MIRITIKKRVNDPEELWDGMPEFDQKKQRPYAEMMVRFENAEDLARFEQLMEQKVTAKTKSLWFPFKPRGEHGSKRWY